MFYEHGRAFQQLSDIVLINELLFSGHFCNFHAHSVCLPQMNNYLYDNPWQSAAFYGSQTS